MATKEDILEQIVEEYLIYKGYFVQHNVKFLPHKDHPDFDSILDSNHSDIDVIGFNPKLSGVNKIWAVSCKSWQKGFSPEVKLKEISENKIVSGREAWKGFRELVNSKWSEAFIHAVEGVTGNRSFTYVTAVAKLKGDKSKWENHQSFRDALGGNPIRVITFAEMINEMRSEKSTTLATSEVGRLIQMFDAADIELSFKSN